MRTLTALVALLLAVGILSRAAAAPPDPARDSVLSSCVRVDVGSDKPAVLQSLVEVCTKALSNPTLEQADRAEAHLARGMAYRNLGQLPASLTDLLKAKDLAANDANVARMLGWTYREMDMHEQSEREYDRALQLDPHWQAYLSRCVVRLDRNEFAKALPDCETANKQHKSEDSLYFMALAYQGLGRHADIEPLIAPELSGQWASGRLYRILSEAYEVSGRKDDAARLLLQAKRRFPHDPKLNQPPPDR
jgi:tetratricopeptide (TPR) repeat protein